MRCLATICSYSLVLMLGSFLGAQQPAAPQQPAAAQQTDEKSTVEKASFLIGYNLVKNMESRGFNLDTNQVIAGINHAIQGNELGMDQEEIQSVMMAMQKIAQQKVTQLRQKQSATNQAEGDQFLARFAQQPGAKEISEGVFRQVLSAGNGQSPTPQNTVKIHYEGKFVNGDVFDSSLEGEPIELAVNQFVPGFSTALQGMKVGDKWMVAIRGDKAYGMNPPPGLEVNKTLVFQIELLEITN